MVTDAKLFLWSPSWGMKKLPSEKSDFPPQNLGMCARKSTCKENCLVARVYCAGVLCLGAYKRKLQDVIARGSQLFACGRFSNL